ncbi:AHH domain-containing protein [Hyalangium rubrum]|uniref:AHH domain-containing protein n=1 Tax=Hyalangium rubrum TaxID=3103134 RepID=A0ABU5HHF8_9BACT|nr:AHH domain-containing protein [Hyalangium sp. s54d21]MDY7232893.1 AHH domain-containing protein [Hyalangium sp. s54d21]
MLLPRATALLMALVVGCNGTSRIVHSDTGKGGSIVIRIPRSNQAAPVKLEADEFAPAFRGVARQVRLLGTARETVRRTFLLDTLSLDTLSGDFLYLPRDRKLVPMGGGASLEGALTAEEEKLADDYRGWCSRAHGFVGDCLGGALVGGRYLDLQGRYVLALALSKSPVISEMQAALGEMVSFQAIMSAALWMIMTLLVLLAIPEPVTKGLAASLAVVLIFWVGIETLYNLVTGWLELAQEVTSATTFEELRAAGERYGKRIGRDAARVLAMLAVAAIGQTAQGFAGKVQTLPGSAQVATQAEAQAGFSLSAAGMVEEVAVTAEGFSMTLPPGVVAMAAGAGRGNDTCIETHHIATICNDKSASRGGPWTPRFRELFAKAGMKLNDPANRLPVQGHKGPHPERYHRIVYDRVVRATATCRSITECRAKLTQTLERLAQEIGTPGTELNQLVTQGNPR